MRVDIFCVAVVELRLDSERRIANQVEDAVALEAVVVNTAAGANHEPLRSSHVPCNAKTRSPERGGAILQILGFAIDTRLHDAVRDTSRAGTM